MENLDFGVVFEGSKHTPSRVSFRAVRETGMDSWPPLLISLGVGHIPHMYMVFDSLYMEIHAWSMPWSWLYHYTIKPHVAFRQRSIREGSASG